MIDKEPERYYDWMLWKMRQEDSKMEYKVDRGLNLDPSGNEQYRRQLVAATDTHELLKENIRQLQSDYYKLINRIKELSEENNSLKEQLTELKQRVHNY